MEKKQLEMLIIQNQHAIHAMALSLARNTYDAEDLQQETILRMLTASHQFDGSSFGCWCYVIMQNIFRKECHRNQRIDYVEDYLCADYTYGVVDIFELRDAIHSLSCKLSSTLSLYLSGYLYEEIAAMQDIPIGTVKSRMNMARRKIANML